MSKPSHLVSLTFDDALDVHLDRAVPLLERYGFRGSFFVTVGAPSFTRRLNDWRRVAADGHELGNHTMLHPAWCHKSYVTEGNAIESYTLDRMRLELEAGNRILAGLDGQRDRTFAYPCCNSILGQPGLGKRVLRGLKLDRTRLMNAVIRHPWLDIRSTERSYEELADELFLAARTGGDRFSAGDGFPPRRSAVPCVSLDGKETDEILALVEAFLHQARGWLVFMAHGLDGGHRLSCKMAALEKLLETLQARSIPVLTFRDAARLVFRISGTDA